MQLKNTLLALLIFAPSLALAGNCPNLISEIDEKLASMPDLSEDTRESIVELRDQGEAMHQSGDHGESVKLLEQALDMLNAAS